MSIPRPGIIMFDTRRCDAFMGGVERRAGIAVSLAKWRHDRRQAAVASVAWGR
jgi:hypothetical protein